MVADLSEALDVPVDRLAQTPSFAWDWDIPNGMIEGLQELLAESVRWATPMETGEISGRERSDRSTDPLNDLSSSVGVEALPPAVSLW